MPIQITRKRERLLEKADQKGYLFHEDAEDIYDEKASISKALKSLCEYGLLQVEPAPDMLDKQKIWEITERGKIFIE